MRGARFSLTSLHFKPRQHGVKVKRDYIVQKMLKLYGGHVVYDV